MYVLVRMSYIHIIHNISVSSLNEIYLTFFCLDWVVIYTCSGNNFLEYIKSHCGEIHNEKELWHIHIHSKNFANTKKNINKMRKGTHKIAQKEFKKLTETWFEEPVKEEN